MPFTETHGTPETASDCLLILHKHYDTEFNMS